MSLADALHQAKATAQRLEIDLAQSKRQRTAMMDQRPVEPVQEYQYSIATEESAPIVDIRNEAVVKKERQAKLQARKQRQNSRGQPFNYNRDPAPATEPMWAGQN